VSGFYTLKHLMLHENVSVLRKKVLSLEKKSWSSSWKKSCLHHWNLSINLGYISINQLISQNCLLVPSKATSTLISRFRRWRRTFSMLSTASIL